MATLQVPPHLRERLAAVVAKCGSVRAAAEAINVSKNQLSNALNTAGRSHESVLTLLEVRLQAYEDQPDDFARKQELAALACDVMADAEKDEPKCAGTTTGAAYRDWPKLLDARAHHRLAALFRYVEGVPAPDGRVLVDSGETIGGSTVWRVLPPPEPGPGPPDAQTVYRALDAMEQLNG